MEGEDGVRFDQAVSRLIRDHRYVRGQSGNSRRAAAAWSGAPLVRGRPPLERIERAGRAAAETRNALMLLIGQLVFNWANNENLLIYVLMLLLRTDESSAEAVFATLSTTRARLDLVRRLAILKVTEPAIRRELESIIEHFNEASQARTDFLDAMYSVNERGEITHIQAMRFVEKRGRVGFGDRLPMDERRLAELKKMADELASLNRTLWDLLPRLRHAVAAQDGRLPA